MKTLLLILFSIIQLTFHIIPLWNLRNSSIDLLLSKSSMKSIIYENFFNYSKIFLTKRITKNEMKITDQNYIKFNGEMEIETDWEDIESIYEINGIYYICPKGKHFINEFFGRFSEIVPYDFNYTDDDWELKCYYQPYEDIMF